MVMSKEKFYGSALHFRTEMSYSDYLKRERRKPKKRKIGKRKDVLSRMLWG
jgi:hypothetical protein